MKLYTFEIPYNITEGRLLPYVKRLLPEIPDYAIREAFEKRDVKLNGVRVSKNASMQPGAELRIYVRETAAKPLLKTVYEDENLLLVAKPIGISCDNDAKGGKTVVQMAHELLLLYTDNEVQPLLCHRLDNQTDGLLLLAKNEDAQQALELGFRQRQIHKEYTCIVRGTPQPEHGLLRAYIKKDAANARVRVFAHEQRGALTMITQYDVLQSGECARLLIHLHTGRTHQIRAHMAFIGHPLLGDDCYGDRAFNKQMKARRLMLSATGLTFSLEGKLAYLNEKRFTFEPEF